MKIRRFSNAVPETLAERDALLRTAAFYAMVGWRASDTGLGTARTVSCLAVIDVTEHGEEAYTAGDGAILISPGDSAFERLPDTLATSDGGRA